MHCRAQILEVYNEKLRDLLNEKETAKPPEIHVHPRVGVYVDGAIDAQVDNLEQLQSLLDNGLSRASVAATGRNPKSSWVAVKELSFSHYIGETLLIAIGTHCGD